MKILEEGQCLLTACPSYVLRPIEVDKCALVLQSQSLMSAHQDVVLRWLVEQVTRVLTFGTIYHTPPLCLRILPAVLTRVLCSALLLLRAVL